MFICRIRYGPHYILFQKSTKQATKNKDITRQTLRYKQYCQNLSISLEYKVGHTDYKRILD